MRVVPLDIMLDDDVNEMAICESSLLRALTNDYAHMNEELQKFSSTEHISNVDELFKSAKKPMPDFDYKDRLERLAAKLYEKDDYYLKGESTIERSVDDLVEKNVASVMAFSSHSTSDVQILLARFESLKPVTQAL